MTAEEKELSKQQKTLDPAGHGGILLPVQKVERPSAQGEVAELKTFSIFLTARRGQTWTVRIATEFLKQHNTVSNYSLPNLP